MPKDHLSNI